MISKLSVLSLKVTDGQVRIALAEDFINPKGLDLNLETLLSCSSKGRDVSLHALPLPPNANYHNGSISWNQDSKAWDLYARGNESSATLYLGEIRGPKPFN